MLSLRVRVMGFYKDIYHEESHTSRVFDNMVSVWPVFHSWANLQKNLQSHLIPYAENTINPHSTFPCQAPWNGFTVTPPVTIDLGTWEPTSDPSENHQGKGKKTSKKTTSYSWYISATYSYSYIRIYIYIYYKIYAGMMLTFLMQIYYTLAKHRLCASELPPIFCFCADFRCCRTGPLNGCPTLGAGKIWPHSSERHLSI